MAERDANEQDMSVHDKLNPSLGPTWEAQDMSRLDRIVVPPPAFTDPNNPTAASGSVNMAIATHPGDISEDYGRSVQPGEDDVQSVIDAHSLEMQQVHTGGDDKDVTEFPEDRDEWQKKHWRAKAEQFGLAVSGNMDTLKDRVEGHEAQVEVAKEWNAAEWKDEIDGVDTPEDLDTLRSLYSQSGAEYSTVDDAFTEKQNALDNPDEN